MGTSLPGRTGTSEGPAPGPARGPALALVQADLSWLEEILRLEAAGFPPEVRESREVFARRLEVFPSGFLVVPREEAGDTGSSAEWSGASGGSGSMHGLTGSDPGRLAAGYFYAEVWSGTQGEFALEHDPAACIDPLGQVIYIASMTVDPALRGRGMGGRLFTAGLNRMKSAFPQADRAVLMVREDWTGARCIYEAQGFRTTGMRSGILGRHKALIMERDLQGY